MSAVLVDPKLEAPELRSRLFQGDIAVFGRLSAVVEMVEHARRSLTELFYPHPPQEIHRHLGPDEMARLLIEWKPRFIHHPLSKELTRKIVKEVGFDPEDSYYDVPKPRTSFPQGHLSDGIAKAFPWHRDTWYAAPSQQLNWWLPIFPLSEFNAMSFDRSAFAESVPNDSDEFDYDRRSQERKQVAKLVAGAQRSDPGANRWTPREDLVLLPEPGGLILFSACHLHRSIPNLSGVSRYSIDFRTVNVSDISAGRGGPMVDVRCTGSAIRDFHSVAANEPIPELAASACVRAHTAQVVSELV